MGPIRTRREWLAAAGSLALAGCSTGADETDRDPYTVEETVPRRTETPNYRSDLSTEAVPDPEEPDDPDPLSVGGEWRRWRGDDGNTGATDVDAVVGEPTVHWRVRGGLPVVRGETLYHTDRSAMSLVARDANTGRIEWTTLVDRGDGIPAVNDSSILVQTYERLFAIRSDGDIRWETSLGPGGASSPVTAGDMAVTCKGSHREWHSGVHGVNLADGSYEWEFLFANRERRGSPATDGTNVYFVTADGSVYSMTADGGQWWQVAIDAAPAASPIVANERLLVADDATLHAIEPESGDRTTRYALPDGLHRGSACADDEAVYVATADAAVALEPWNDVRRWRYEFDGEPSDLVVDAGRAYLATEDGTIHAIDRRDGIRRWRYPPPNGDGAPLDSVSRMAPVEGALYVLAENELVAIGAGAG